MRPGGPTERALKQFQEQEAARNAEELERQKPREEDPNKMTREELLADGWVILSLKSADEVRLRLNSL